MHDRIAHDREFEDVLDLDAGSRRQTANQARDGLAHHPRHLRRPALVEHRVRDTAHEVLAESDLGVHHAVRGEDLAVGEIREVPGDRRRADVEGDPQGAIVEPGPDPADHVPVVDRHCDPVVARVERRLEVADHLEIGLEAGQAPLPLQRDEHAGEVTAGPGQLGPFDLDLMQADYGIDDEVADRHALAHDLPMDLALGRHVDEHVAVDLGTTPESPSRRQPAEPVVLVFVGAARREVPVRGFDAVLGERPLRRHDLAATAQPAPTAHRVEVDAE